MSNSLTYNAKKVLPFIALATAMLLVVGFSLLSVSQTEAARPADFGLTEGNTISAAGSDDPDVYIVNDGGFKRLFLNPVIFSFYGHLGGFAKVKTVSPATRDAFPTSGLFRNCEVNDPKVYGFVSTGEDTGELRWVNTSGAQAVADDPNFFQKVFCINNNEFNWYVKSSTTFTSVNQIPAYTRTPGTGTPSTSTTPSGPLSVSLSPSNPVAQTVTLNSYGVPVMALRFSGNGQIGELILKRGGAGDVSDYDNLYIYDGARRLTGGRTPSSSDGTVTFINLKVDVNGSKDLVLVADHSAVAGNVDYWELQSAKNSTGGAISGPPMRSNNFTFSGSNSGTLDVDKTGSVPNPNVGQKNAQLSEIKITANTEAAFIRRVQLLNGGNVKSSDITNLRLEVNGVKVADGVMTSDGYGVFDFGTPGYKIAKGDNKIFKLFGDVTGKKDETIKFYVDQASDIGGIGDQFGFGMKPTVTNIDASTEAHSLTLQGGVLTIAFNGPNATNIGTDSSDTVLARYSFTALNDIEVRKTRFVLCIDNSGNGFDAGAATTDGWYDLEDFKVTNEDNGQVIIGPANGSAFTTSEATGCPESKTGAAKQFTDTFDLQAGKTYNFKVTADIKTANTNGSNDAGVALDATDIIKVLLDGYGEADNSGSSGDTSVMKYAGTNTAVDDGDIVPNTDLSGNNLTIEASSLTLGLGASPKSNTFVRGTKNVEAVGFTFLAARASDLKVTDITLTGYVDDDGGQPFAKIGSNSDSSLSVGSVVSAVAIYDGDSGTLISNTPQANNLNNSTATIKFTNLSWVIPAGATKRLLVKTDLSTNPTSGAKDYFSFDIDATTDVTALDSSSKTVNAGNADPNNSTAPTVVVTASSSGGITTTALSDPISQAKYWGETDSEFSRFRFKATTEGFFIEKLNLYASDVDEVASATSNVERVKVRYTNKAGQQLTAIGSLNTKASVSFGFTGDNRPYIPKDSSIDIGVFADLKTKSNGATSEVFFSLDLSGGPDTEFRAVGEGSGTIVDGANANIVNRAGNNHYIFRVFPEFVQESLVATEPLGTKDVLKFTVKAHGLSDSKITFDEPASATLRFAVVASGTAPASISLNLYDASTRDLLASAYALGGGLSSQGPHSSNAAGRRASVNFSDWEKDFEIIGGQQKTFVVEAAFANFTDKSDYFQLILRDGDSNVVVSYVDGAGTAEDNTIQLKVPLATDPAYQRNYTGFFRTLPMNGPFFTKQ